MNRVCVTQETLVEVVASRQEWMKVQQKDFFERAESSMPSLTSKPSPCHSRVLVSLEKALICLKLFVRTIRKPLWMLKNFL